MSALNREELVRALPYARRFARALAGGQSAGDALVARVLREELPPMPARLALYAAISRIAPLMPEPAAGLGHRERQLLLLTALEDLKLPEAAEVVGMQATAAEESLAAAKTKLRSTAATDVLIIEDEPIIAMDLAMLVEECGHRVIGTAASEAEALAIALAHMPGLILADINLGAGGDGTSAVARILESTKVPVIFVTAYPERLLTGERVEPAFVITKPFEPLTLAIATYQAVSGGVPVP